ncbi:hypothetical protein L596_027149 [Steinernema carpocapsae]|uniref:Uncharacterized protein n=1 Tax=Steinernema carpocapsae TaxID=34508 RepID=A0A4U5M3G5_STECR|nr:hypothetical protein L596_027149 [Steinernema carpocapsae]
MANSFKKHYINLPYFTVAIARNLQDPEKVNDIVRNQDWEELKKWAIDGKTVLETIDGNHRLEVLQKLKKTDFLVQCKIYQEMENTAPARHVQAERSHFKIIRHDRPVSALGLTLEKTRDAQCPWSFMDRLINISNLMPDRKSATIKSITYFEETDTFIQALKSGLTHFTHKTLLKPIFKKFETLTPLENKENYIELMSNQKALRKVFPFYKSNVFLGFCKMFGNRSNQRNKPREKTNEESGEMLEKWDNFLERNPNFCDMRRYMPLLEENSFDKVYQWISDGCKIDDEHLRFLLKSDIVTVLQELPFKLPATRMAPLWLTKTKESRDKRIRIARCLHIPIHQTINNHLLQLRPYKKHLQINAGPNLPKERPAT